MKNKLLFFLMGVILFCSLASKANAATYTVTNCADSGPGSLSDAINSSEANIGIVDTIAFNIPTTEAGYTTEAGASFWRIKPPPSTGLPTIRDTVIIDGSTQTSNQGDTNPYGPEIMIDGSSVPGWPGLEIETNECVVKDLVISNFSAYAAIYIGGQSNRVYGCYIGTNAKADTAAGNSYGLELVGPSNIIGSTETSGRNIISGNTLQGIIIDNYSNSNEVYGNYIGLDRIGTTALGNYEGIALLNGIQNNIIGSVAGPNVISGNTTEGIHFFGASYNQVSGNYIGVTAAGNSGLGNGDCGIKIDSAYGEGGSGPSIYNTIGNQNVISGNLTGVCISSEGTNNNQVIGNFIGTDSTGSSAIGNATGIYILDRAKNNIIGSSESSRRNIISGNSGRGIYITDLGTDSNLMLGNYVGTDVNGTANLGNSFGIYLSNGPKFNEIGGAVAGQGNVISGNTYGIMMYETGTDSNEVLGNFIGTDVNGTASLGNSQTGVYIVAGITGGGKYNKIGNGTPGGRNVISKNYNGVTIADAENNEVLGNYIGTDVNGTANLGNSKHGVNIFFNSRFNKIGDGTSGGRNIISGNYIGVDLAGSGPAVPNNNEILGNYIGTDKNGTAALGNSDSGVYLEYAAQYNKIGGVTAGEGNIISGNGAYGIYITGSGTDSNEAAGNHIGTRIDGISGLSNSSGGIEIADTARFNQVGPLNVIAYNGGPGVSVEGFGTDFNRIAQNSMFENSGLGIELLNSSNGGIAAPTIITALNDLATGEAVPNATIELFSTGSPDPTASGEGRTYLGSTTEASGSWLIALALTGETTITATATDSNNNTSMFSMNNVTPTTTTTTTSTTTTTTSTVPGTTTTTTTTTTTIKYPTMVILTAEATVNAIDVTWEASYDPLGPPPSGIDFYILFRGRKSSAEVEIIDNFDSSDFDVHTWANKLAIGCSFETIQSGDGKLKIKQIGSLVGDKDNVSVAGYYTAVSYEAKPRFVKISTDVNISHSSVSHNGKHDYLLAGPIINAGSFDAFVFPWLGKNSTITLPGYLFGGEHQDPQGVGTTVPDSGTISGILAGEGLSLFFDNKYLGLFINPKGSDLPHYFGFITLVATTAANTDVDFDNFYAGEYPVEMVASLDASTLFYHDTDVIVGETYFYAVSPNSVSGKSGSNVAEAQLTTTTTTTTSTSTISTTTTTLHSGLSGFSKVSPVLRPGAALNIDFLSKETGNYTMFIFYQSTGVMVRDIPFTTTPGKNRVSWVPDGKTLTINTGEEAPPGIYYYEIRSSSGTLVTWGNFVVVKTI